MHHSRFNPVPFKQRSRRARNRDYIDLKNRIRRAAPILGGTFFTHDYIHGGNGWADVFFLGHKAPDFYNATLQTTRYAYRELVQERASELSFALVPPGEHDFLARIINNANTALNELPPRKPTRHAAFGDLTRHEWMEQQLPALANSGGVQVFEEWTLDRHYCYGIGLHATLNLPFLDVPAINAFIQRFLGKPENHRDPTPHSYSFEQIGWWGLESNALIDPWDWPAPTSG